METLVTFPFTTSDYILLFIALYCVQLFIVELLITLLNTISSDYGTTPVHYFLPFISIIAYLIILIEECYDLFVKPRLIKLFNRITKY